MGSTGSHYRLRDEASGEEFTARLSGKLRLQGSRATNPVVVGDVVQYQRDDAGEATISGIDPRKNYIIRRASNLSRESHILAANIDQALVVATIDRPRTSFEFIDRFLVTCEAYSIPVRIVLNKVDLAREDADSLENFLEIYKLAGYEVLPVCALSGEGIEGLRESLKGQTTLVAGHSGVGKSTLISAIEPTAEARTGEISKAHRKGVHTTTFSRMYPLTTGGYIIDTPGIKGFGLIDFEDREVARYFPDLMAAAAGCQYYNCTHSHEPGCAVIAAVEEGRISEQRYISYLKIVAQDDTKYR